MLQCREPQVWLAAMRYLDGRARFTSTCRLAPKCLPYWSNSCLGHFGHNPSDRVSCGSSRRCSGFAWVCGPLLSGIWSDDLFSDGVARCSRPSRWSHRHRVTGRGASGCPQTRLERRGARVSSGALLGLRASPSLSIALNECHRQGCQ